MGFRVHLVIMGEFVNCCGLISSCVKRGDELVNVKHLEDGLALSKDM